MTSKTEITITLPVGTAFTLLGFIHSAIGRVPMQPPALLAVDDIRNRLREALKVLPVE